MGTIDNHQGFKLRFGEFPDLLFTAIDTRTYFDMTHFLQSMNLDPEEKIAEFTAGFALWIEHLAKMYGIPPAGRMFCRRCRNETLSGRRVLRTAVPLLY